MLPTIHEEEIMSYRISVISEKSYLPASEILPTRQYRFKNDTISLPKVLIIMGIILMAAIMVFALHE